MKEKVGEIKLYWDQSNVTIKLGDFAIDYPLLQVDEKNTLWRALKSIPIILFPLKDPFVDNPSLQTEHFCESHL